MNGADVVLGVRGEIGRAETAQIVAEFLQGNIGFAALQVAPRVSIQVRRGTGAGIHRGCGRRAGGGWRSGRRRLHHLHGVIQIGHLRLHFFHQAGEIRDRLLQRGEIARQAVHPGGKSDHRRDNLAFQLGTTLLGTTLDDGHRGGGAIAGIHGLLHQHGEGCKLLVLRLLELPDLFLQQRHIALQFLHFLAGGGERHYGRGRQNQNAQTSKHRTPLRKRKGADARPLPVLPCAGERLLAG